jgi:hypothetical protein
MRGSKLGIFLIVIGLLIFFSNMELLSGSIFLFVVGTAFLYGYIKSDKETKPFGLLVPAYMTFALGVMNAVEPFLGAIEGGLFFFLVGGGFMAVHWTHMRFEGREKDTKWAHKTGLGIAAFGAFVLLTELADLTLFSMSKPIMLPVIFVGLGLYLLFANKKANHKGHGDF